MTILFTVLLYNKEVDLRETNNWCIDTKEIEAWILTDEHGNLYRFTSKELYNIPDSTYGKMRHQTRIKQIIFRDVDFIGNVE